MPNLFQFRLLVAARRLFYLAAVMLTAQGAAGQGAAIPGLPHWRWQNPLPTGYGLLDLHAFNDSTAIAVGARGTCIKTRDRGRTWQVLNVGTRNRLSFVSFANDLVGWVAVYNPPSDNSGNNGIPPILGYGGRSEVRKTTDGGLTWTVQRPDPAVTGTRIWGLQAVSATECYVIYDELTCYRRGYPCGGYPNILLRHTTDGGATWAMSGWPFAFNSNARFVTPRTAYVGVAENNNAGSLNKTTDGGVTWRNISPAPNRNWGAVSFPDSLHGWVISSRYDWVTFSGPNLYRTRDGGRRWVAQRVRLQPQDSTGVIHHIAFTDTLHGVAVGDYGLAYRTRDGGTTWEAVVDSALGPLARYVLPYEGLSVLRPAVGGTGIWGAGALVVRSADRGASWTTTTPTALPRVNGAQHPLRKVQIVSPTDAWAWTDYSLLRTATRGARWAAVPLDSVPGMVRGVHFVDRDTGFVLTQYQTSGSSLAQTGAVGRTTDGGRTWTRQVVAPTVLTNPFSYEHPAPGLQTMAFGSAQRGLIVGDQGQLLLTTDGGLTWAPRPSGTPHALRTISWAGPGAQTVYVGGDSATLCRSDDGGQTWRRIPVDSLQWMWFPTQTRRDAFDQVNTLRGFQFVSPEVGYMPAGTGIAKTTNGGRTWVSTAHLESQGQISTYGRPDPSSRNVFFRTPREGWFFGSDNFRTQDGGTTWVKTPDVLGDAYGVSLMYGAMADRHNAWVIGPGDGILHFSEKFIRTDTALARTSFCLSDGADSVSVPFTLEGTFAPAERDFRVELSNAKGRFRPGQTTLVGRGAASPLLARLPATLPAGTYRLRVIRADSTVLGADNGVDLLVSRRPAAVAVAPADSTSFCAGDSVQLAAPAGFGAYQWTTGATTRAVWVRAGGAYAVRVGGRSDCLSPASDSVRVRVRAVPAQAVVTAAVQPSGIVVLTSSAATGNQWFLNGAPIGGATGITYVVSTAAQSGAYTVQVTRGGCAGPVSAPIAIAVTGTAEDAAAALLTVSPNPAHGHVVVRAASGLLTVCLTDLSGREVARATGAGDAAGITVPLTGVAAGTYLLRAAVRSGATAVHRLVVE